jgi:hypothetical protein
MREDLDELKQRIVHCLDVNELLDLLDLELADLVDLLDEEIEENYARLDRATR